MLHKLAKFPHQTMFTTQIIKQNVLCFMLRPFDDVIKLEYLKS